MTRKIATMRSRDRATWRETAPTPLPSLFFYHERLVLLVRELAFVVDFDVFLRGGGLLECS
jgi:hypothetical protein